VTNPDRPSIQELVEAVNESNIASIKNVAAGIIKIINNINSSAKDLENLVKLDPPLTAKVLQVANSAFYRGSYRIDTLSDAIMRVGFDTFKRLALAQKVRDIFEKKDLYEGYSRVLLWKHAIAVSHLAKLIFSERFDESGETIYTAGLLHNIGIIAEDQFLEERFKEVLKRSHTENRDLTQLEDDLLGFNHPELGQAILQKWDLPDELAIAVGYHHKPAEAAEAYRENACVLYMADFICQERGYGYNDTKNRENSVFESCCRELGMASTALDPLVSDLEDELLTISSQGLF